MQKFHFVEAERQLGLVPFYLLFASQNAFALVFDNSAHCLGFLTATGAQDLFRGCCDNDAMRLYMDRISAPRRDALIKTNFSAIRTAQDVDRAAEKVTSAIRRGEMTPSEGETLMNILESRMRVLEKVDFEPRLKSLEQNLREDRPGGDHSG